MTFKEITSKYGLIGDNLDLKENVFLKLTGDGKISEINYENPKNVIDFSDKSNNFLMIPGLINSHIHMVDSFAKEKGFNKDIIEIVAPPDGLKHKLLNHISAEIKSYGIQQALLEMLSNGITCFVDFRERGIEGIHLLKNALQNHPINYLILGRFRNDSDLISVFKEADGIGLSSYGNLSIQIKEKLTHYKKKFNKLIACHDAEVKRDEKLFNEIILDELVDIIIHGTQYQNEELHIIKEKKLSLVLCPRSNGYFGVGFPPIIEILKLQIPISLGTDNLMVNNTDLFEEIRYLYRIARVLARKSETFDLDAKTLLKMITINAARNFQIDQNCGSIKKGKNADFCMIDLSDPNFYSYKIEPNEFFALITQRTKSENIKEVYIKGERVFERN